MLLLLIGLLLGQSEEAPSLEPDPSGFLDQQLQDAEDDVTKAEEALKKKCGKDYMNVQIGMRFARVRECSGPFRLRYEDAAAKVYDAAGGSVRVEKGRITRVYRR